MRLDAWIFGLAACLAAGSAKASDGDKLSRSTQPNTKISFQQFSLPNVFLNDKDPLIEWTVVESDLTVTAAFLKRVNGSGVVAGSSIHDSNVGRSEDVATNQLAVRDQNSRMSFNPGSTTGSVTLNINSQREQYSFIGAFNQALYLELTWALTTGENGQSTTPVFAVSNLTTSDPLYSALVNTLSSQVTDDELPFQEESAPTSVATTQFFAPTPAGGTGNPSAITVTPTTTSSPESSGASLAPGSGSSGSSLSTGAVVGIAVACGVVGLALVSALVWFMCFRRRRNDHTALGQHTGGYASDGAAAMMADKEMPHVSADSPRSTYASDRGQLSHDLPIGSSGGADPRHSMAAAAATAHDDMPYVPYSDRAPTSADRRSQTDLAGATGTRSPTPPISTRYAHLIEEGMTEDEIRRLDDEERQLDAAIEVAGRSSRAA